MGNYFTDSVAIPPQDGGNQRWNEFCIKVSLKQNIMKSEKTKNEAADKKHSSTEKSQQKGSSAAKQVEPSKTGKEKKYSEDEDDQPKGPMNKRSGEDNDETDSEGEDQGHGSSRKGR